MPFLGAGGNTIIVCAYFYSRKIILGAVIVKKLITSTTNMLISVPYGLFMLGYPDGSHRTVP